MKKTAIIVGSEGQDGKILWEQLVERGYRILGIDQEFVRSEDLHWRGSVDISHDDAVAKVVRKVTPDEIYYLAAFHGSSEDTELNTKELFRVSHEIHVSSLLYFLDAIKMYSPRTRIFYAASSLVFGEVREEVQNEMTPFCPNSVYGITKLSGLFLCRFYRSVHSVFAATGILYNHESVYRSDKFISMKIVQAAVDIKKGLRRELTIGDMRAEVDWGYAPDFTDAMQRMLQLPVPDDYVVATGEKHKVEDIVRVAFGHLGLDWKMYVKQDKQILTRKRKAMVGNSDKLRKATEWRPTVGFDDMIQRMVEYKQKIQ